MSSRRRHTERGLARSSAREKRQGQRRDYCQMARLFISIGLLALAGCYACSRHVSSVRTDTVRPDRGLSMKYRLADLSLAKPTLSADEDAEKAAKYHSEDTAKAYEVVKNSLLRNYPEVFTDSVEATPLSVFVGWNTSYQGDPITQSIITYMVVPETAEQETVYTIRTTAREGGTTWSEKAHASRFSETWETWLLPTGFIPIPGKSDWPRTFCFLRLGKDAIVYSPSDVLKTKSCIRSLVFDPKVDGDVLAAAIMRTVNRHHRSVELAALMRKGGAK